MARVRQPRLDQKLAVALRYAPEDGDEAPVVTAKGTGAFADRILQTAKEHGIPVEKNKPLVQVLSTLDLDQQIPPAIYTAVARILSFIYRLNRSANSGGGKHA